MYGRKASNFVLKFFSKLLSSSLFCLIAELKLVSHIITIHNIEGFVLVFFFIFFISIVFVNVVIIGLPSRGGVGATEIRGLWRREGFYVIHSLYSE